MRTNSKWRLKRSFVFLVLAMVLAGFIAFVEKRGSEKVFQSIEVYVEGVSDVYFVEEKEILKTLENEFPELQAGFPLSKIALDKLEEKVENHPFVKNAEVFSELKGKIIVKVSQHRPIARIARPVAADGYISSEGLILPVSGNYTSRVLILEGAGAEKLLEMENVAEEQEDLLELIRFIQKDKFWNAQIASLEIDSKGNINMYQQVGKQVIEFGRPNEIEEKFKKIQLFYKDILPQKGWNNYKRVSVKYKDQIVCE